MGKPISPSSVLDHTVDNKFWKLAYGPLTLDIALPLGNALRRILLTSITGATVTAVEIRGVIHEFSVLPGVREDVLTIIKNIKGLAIILNDGEKEATLKINETGTGKNTGTEIKAVHINCMGKAKILNSDHHIATLDSTGELSMEILVEKGIGYMPAESNISVEKRNQNLSSENNRPIETRWLPVDVNFNPIYKVSIRNTVENHMVLDAWSNGTVEPVEAIKQAITIFRGFINSLQNRDCSEYIESIESKDGLVKNLGKFIITGLERGVGNTIGAILQEIILGQYKYVVQQNPSSPLSNISSSFRFIKHVQFKVAEDGIWGEKEKLIVQIHTAGSIEPNTILNAACDSLSCILENMVESCLQKNGEIEHTRTPIYAEMQIEHPSHVYEIKSGNRSRLSFARLKEIGNLDLNAIHKESYDDFLEYGIESALKDVFPISDYEEKIILKIIDPKLDENECASEEKCRRLGLTYQKTLRAKVLLTYGKLELEDELTIASIPVRTERGTFINKGIEYVIVNQILRAPGIYFIKESDEQEVNYSAHLITSRGTNIKLHFVVKLVGDNEAYQIKVISPYSKKKTFIIMADEIQETSEDIGKNFRDLLYAVGADYKEKKRKRYIYRKKIQIQKKIKVPKRKMCKLGNLCRLYLNKKLYDKNSGPNSDYLTMTDVTAIIKYITLRTGDGDKTWDDFDHFENKLFRSAGDIIFSQFSQILKKIAFKIKKEMNQWKLGEDDQLKKEYIEIIKEIFKPEGQTEKISATILLSGNPLVQFAEQKNPLSQLAHLRRVSPFGPGGLTSNHVSLAMRDIHFSQYGRVCPIDTPEGGNVGLMGNLAIFAGVESPSSHEAKPDSYIGFNMLTSPYREVKDEKITDKVINLTAGDEKKYWIISADESAGINLNSSVSCTARRGSMINEITGDQISYADISPQQILSLSTSLIPFLEHNDAVRAAMGASMLRQSVPLLSPEAPMIGTGLEGIIARQSSLAVVARQAGTVVKVTASEIVISASEEGQDCYNLINYKSSNQETCIHQKPIVRQGDQVEKGQVIADGPAMENGELALGRNVLVAFMPWRGYNYEDAILISQRLVKDDVFTSLHIQEYVCEVYNKYEKVENLKDKDKNFEKRGLCYQNGVVSEGSQVRQGDILVNKVYFGDSNLYENVVSLKMPPGESGVVVKVDDITDKNLPVKNGFQISRIIRVFVAQKRKITVGDKMAGRHGNKGVVSKILPDQDMPFLSDGTPVDIVLNPLGVPSRMNLGQILETHLGLAAKKLGLFFVSPPFDGANEKDIETYLELAGEHDGWKKELYDGLTGKPFDQKVTVGYMYFLKLAHLVEDKMHARSTGPYDRVTQQPVGGKSRGGGQRFGEMEVWALEAYGAWHNLREVLTFKSDDIYGQNESYKNFFESKTESIIVKGYLPASFRLMVKEIKSLCLDVRCLDEDNKELLIGSKNKENNKEINIEPVELDRLVCIETGLPSKENIKEWSSGEVTKTVLYNKQRSKKNTKNNPKENGLFCQEIFGGIGSPLRRERMGHIELAVPIAHIWFTKAKPNQIAALLKMKVIDVQNIIYGKCFIILADGNSADSKYYKKGTLLTQEQYKQVNSAGTGALAIRKLLEELTPEELKKWKGTSPPENMIIKVLPILPPDLRPINFRIDGSVEVDDLNNSYIRIIQKNNKLKEKLSEENNWDENNGILPEGIIDLSIDLQREIDMLLDNSLVNGDFNYNVKSQRVNPKTWLPVTSLSDRLRGKEGRFRSNLLGKRVDFSGRSVIVVGPEYSFNQCGIPRKMAIELFRPFIVKSLLQGKKLDSESKEFKDLTNEIEEKIDAAYHDTKSEVWEKLMEIVRGSYILLNRAPTLHSLGIQAFRPVLIDGEAIHIPPMICSGFNADFDGDTMAVHTPISKEAQKEARWLMNASLNILNVQNNRPVVTPTQDIVLGIYYLTMESTGEWESNKIHCFENEDEAIMAYHSGLIKLHEHIQVGQSKCRDAEVSVGRLIFNQVLPSWVDFINKAVKKKDLEKIILSIYTGYGTRYISKLIQRYSKRGENKSVLQFFTKSQFIQRYRKRGNTISKDKIIILTWRLAARNTVRILDNLKELGFLYATKAGISIGIKDVIIPPEKKGIIMGTKQAIEQLSDKNSLMTDIGKKWYEATEKIKIHTIKALKNHNLQNPILMMTESGARGSDKQIVQLAGIRGLMDSISGKMPERAITSNFLEGIGILDYYVSAYGARKGIADRAVQTEKTGYLTRRLVYAAQDVIISEEDCLSEHNIADVGVSWHQFAETILKYYQKEYIAECLDGAKLLESVSLTTIFRNTEIEVQLEPKTILDKSHAKNIAIQVVLQKIKDFRFTKIKDNKTMSIKDVLKGTKELKSYTQNLIDIFAAHLENRVLLGKIDLPGTCSLKGAMKFGEESEGGVINPGQEITKEQAVKIAELSVLGEGALDFRFRSILTCLAKKGICRHCYGRDLSLYPSLNKYSLESAGNLVELGKAVGIIAAQSIGERGTQLTMTTFHTGGVAGKDITKSFSDLEMLFEADKNVVIPEMEWLNKLNPIAPQVYLLHAIQKIFRANNVEIKDKHVEVIVRQMSKPATGKKGIVGIKNVALKKNSFLAAASFEQAPRVLSQAAIAGKTDLLEGMIERVIAAKVLPRT